MTANLLEKRNILFEVDEECPSIEKTTEYDVFKTMQGNRQISESHVKNLIGFIQKRNLLKGNPILVNEHFEVVDGQHRLEAARQLKKTVYYICIPGLTYLDAGILNACTDDWEFQEYLKNYAENGHQEYIELDNFKQKHGLTLKRLQILMSKEQKKIFDETFKIGNFVIIDDLEDVSEKISSIKEIIEYLEVLLLSESKRFLYTDSFWKALYQFLSKEKVDIEKFKEKLQVKHMSVRQTATYKDYVKMFTQIYNWKMKKRIN